MSDNIPAGELFEINYRIRIPKLLKRLDLVASHAEGERLIKYGAVYVRSDDSGRVKVTDPTWLLPTDVPFIIECGRQIKRVKLSSGMVTAMTVETLPDEA